MDLLFVRILVKPVDLVIFGWIVGLSITMIVRGQLLFLPMHLFALDIKLESLILAQNERWRHA